MGLGGMRGENVTVEHVTNDAYVKPGQEDLCASEGVIRLGRDVALDAGEHRSKITAGHKHKRASSGSLIERSITTNNFRFLRGRSPTSHVH